MPSNDKSMEKKYTHFGKIRNLAESSGNELSATKCLVWVINIHQQHTPHDGDDMDREIHGVAKEMQSKGVACFPRGRHSKFRHCMDYRDYSGNRFFHACTFVLPRLSASVQRCHQYQGHKPSEKRNLQRSSRSESDLRLIRGCCDTHGSP